MSTAYEFYYKNNITTDGEIVSEKVDHSVTKTFKDGDEANAFATGLNMGGASDVRWGEV